VITEATGQPALVSSYADEQWQCPQCRVSMNRLSFGRYPTCPQCRFTLGFSDGIWRALAPDREKYFRQFVMDYVKIRSIEGRGSTLSEYYLQLPFKDLIGRNSWQWKIRSASFVYFYRTILPVIARYREAPLDVLDLGAGNCWLSYRLSLLGHACTAVDLLDNSKDGLGAARHYIQALDRPICCVQAEMDSLPWPSGQFDVAIFNASLHYSENYSRTISEAVRCLRPGGHLVIIDSPWYSNNSSGLEMVRERREQFTNTYGFPSNSLDSLEFLTPEILDQLAEEFHWTWQIVKPWYGWKWALRPLKARLQGRRQPSKFYIFWAQVPR